MVITIESTSKVVMLNGVPARIWEGQTDTGIKVHAFITRIAAAKEASQVQFESELQEHRPPSADIQAYPLRLLI
jgi:hypothetical protein